MPTHNHPISGPGQTFTPAGAGGYVASAAGGSGQGLNTSQWSYSVGNRGGSAAHNNVQPSLTALIVIKT